jgi:TRAP transporter TAXI family solute receptor
MARSQRTLSSLLLLFCASATTVVTFTCGRPREARNLVISTGTEGGTYVVVGEQMARILETYPQKGIGEVHSRPSAGSIENVDRLVASEADLGLVVGPVLASHPDRQKVRALMALYSDRWQVVVRRNTSIRTLRDMKGKRIFIGADGSGTKWGATRILRAAADLSDSDYLRVNVHSYWEAAEKLQAGEADAAFFITATPAKAVSAALSSGCCELLDLRESADSIMADVPGLSADRIPPHLYENQPSPVHTLSATAVLVGRTDLRDDIVLRVLNALFDHLGDLAVAHIRVQEVRLSRAFTTLPRGVQLHPGATKFQAQESEKLQIATGVINGKYYDLGKRIQLVLEKEGIAARAIHTDGSLENLRLLKAKERPTLAVVQYDTALASIWSTNLYQTPDVVDALHIPRVSDLRRIASLHEESFHALIRNDRIPTNMRDRPTLRALENQRVCLGPKGSGTQVLAKVLLRRHGIRPSEEVYLSIPEMVARIHGEEIDAGFFMSHIPSEALKTVVHDQRNRLLSIDPSKVSGMLGPALGMSKIEASMYGAQSTDEAPVETVATRAVLVSTEDLPFDVRRITEAVFEGAAFLGVEGGGQGVARVLPSLPLHPDAEKYYREAGYLPSPQPIDWLTNTWRSLAILVIMVGGYQGLLKLRRDATANEVGRRILAISLEASEPGSVHQLVEIRDAEIRERVQRRWWRGGELDKGRWRYLHDLTNDRIKEAKENLTAALAEDLRKLATETGLDNPAGRARLRSLEGRVWGYFQKGELDASHQALLLEVIQRILHQPSGSTAE